MSSTQKPNLCTELKQAHDQLLDLKKEFDSLISDLNSLRPNFSKNMPEIKTKISKMQDSRAQIEEKMFEIMYTQNNNYDRVQAIVKKYVPKLLSRIEKKTTSQQNLSPIELTILYDIKDKIISILSENQQQKVQEIRDKRDKKVDAPQVLELKPVEIAWEEKEVSKNTKAYIGTLFPGFFTKLGHLEHIYTAFPEGKIRKHDLEIGDKTENQLALELRAKNIRMNSWVIDLLFSDDFERSQQKIVKLGIKDIELVQLTVKSLGFSDSVGTKQIFQKAQQFGLNLCSAEVGPNLRLQYSGKESINIAMESIVDSDGYLDAFKLYSDGEQLELYAYPAESNLGWDTNSRWIFSLTKLDS